MPKSASIATNSKAQSLSRRGVHAALLPSTRAKIGAFVEWAWDYFGKSRGDAVLDRSEEMQIDWNDETEETASAAPAANSQTDKPP